MATSTNNRNDSVVTARIINTANFRTAMQEGKQVAVPRTFKGGKMHFYQVFPETIYDTSAFGVEEPPLTAAEITATAIDLLIVPGIVFNRAGYRIGFGGGFYDRYLEHFRVCM